MYRITCDGHTILDTRLEDYIILEPKVNVETNTVGECTFKIYSNHPHYADLYPLKSIFEVSDENGVIFRGRMTNNTRDFYNGKAVDLEGAMAFFNDTMVKPFVFPDDFSGVSGSRNVVEYFLNWLIEQHNSQVQDFQKFRLGRVTVTDPNNYLSRSSESIASTWDTLREKLFESNLGGHLCIRYGEDSNYIDYLADFDEVNTQEIKLGENLLDMKCETDASATYTAIIPIGADIEVKGEDGKTTTKKLTLESIADGRVSSSQDIYKVTLENGLHALYDNSAVYDIGWICCPIEDSTWDDITDANNLKNRAYSFLSGTASLMANRIEVTAADLHFTDEEISAFRIYKKVKVISKIHGVDTYYKLTKLEIDLLNPQNTKIVVGTPSKTLTSAVSGGGSGGSGGYSGSSGGGGIVEELDPTVPSWAKQPNKPTYTAAEVGARPNTWTPTASEVGADPSGTASSLVSGHNTNTEAHNDIRILINELTTRLNTLADSDDTTLDQMSELVAYIKANRSLIEEVTTNKVNVSDIIDNLTTNVSNKPLSAAQGVALKGLIDELSQNALTASDVVDSLASDATDKPLSANQGMRLDLMKVSVSSIVDDLTTEETSKPLSARQGFVLKALIDSITESELTKSDVIDHLQSNATDKPLSANQGMYLNLHKVDYSDVINNLTSDEVIKPLSAKQGKVLKGLIDTLEKKVPTKTSDITNDSGFLTSIPDNYVTEKELEDKGYLTSVPDEYVTEKELEEKGYLTEVPDAYVTEEELTDKGYLTEVPSKYVTYDALNNRNYMTESEFNLGLYPIVKSVNNLKPDANGNVNIVGEDGTLNHTHTWSDIATTYEDLVINSDGANHGGYVKVSDEVLTLDKLEEGGTVTFTENGAEKVTMNYPEGTMTVMALSSGKGAAIAYNGLTLAVFAFEDGVKYFTNTFEKGIYFVQDDWVITHSLTIPDYIQTDEINPIPFEYLPIEDIKQLIKEVIEEVSGGGAELLDSNGHNLYDVLYNKLIAKE